MLFWKLQSPDYDSDYQETFINGSLNYPYRLPLMRCDACGKPCRGSRILRFECSPQDWDSFQIGKGWPIKSDQHLALQLRIREHFSKRGIVLPSLQTGDCFLPCYLDVPSRPRADFLWSSLHSVVISERVRQLFQSLKVPGVEFYEVRLGKIGKREAHLLPPEPSAGEPEDMIVEALRLSDTHAIGPYFDLVPQTKSDYPPGAEPLSPCISCGYYSYGSRRQLIMTDAMWRGFPVFYLATTGYILVTDDFRQVLQAHNFSNVRFTPYPAA